MWKQYKAEQQHKVQTAVISSPENNIAGIRIAYCTHIFSHSKAFR
jgi:hypothetical protein